MLAPSLQRPLVICYCDTDLVHAAHPVTGLIELADGGEVDLRFRFRDRKTRGFGGRFTLRLRIETSNSSSAVAIDLHDGAEYLSESSLRDCVLYYKVNLHERTVARAPMALRGKLRPYGPYFPCRPRRDRALLRRSLFDLAVKAQHRFLYAVEPMSWQAKIRDFASQITRRKRYLSRKTWNDYETAPRDAAHYADGKILFNPTCWDESEADEIRVMNEFRARLIVALRQEFGKRFIGGFRNSGPSVSRYPEAIECEPIPHDAYLRYLRESPLVIYSNGKFGCFSWRLAEAFAASQCLVSERIPNWAGVPLDESVGCLQCETVEEIVAALHRLAGEPESVAEYSRRASRYYLERLRPQSRMRLLIDEVVRN